MLTCKDSSAANAGTHPMTVRIGLLANPTRRDRLNETLTIHASTADETAMLASAGRL